MALNKQFKLFLPVIKKSYEIGGYGNIICYSKMGIIFHDRIPDIIPPIKHGNNKDETHVAASVTGSNHNGSNGVMSSVCKKFETSDLI
jgi:hypothetical protein